MRIIIILDDGFEYEHTLTDPNITLAQLLTDVYVGLHRVGKLDIDLNPVYLQQFAKDPARSECLRQQSLNFKLNKLILEQQEKYTAKLTSKLPDKYSAKKEYYNLSLTALLHFVTHPKTADKTITEILLNTIIKDGKDACGNTARHLRARMGVWHEVGFQHDINEKNISSDTIEDHEGEGLRNTALHLAAFHGHVSFVSALIGAGAKLNEKNVEGRIQRDRNKSDAPNDTPLHIGAGRGHFGVVKVLLEAKAEVNARNAIGFTPLHSNLHVGRAVNSGECNLEIVSLLLDKGADANARDHMGRTPLMMLGERGMTISETGLETAQRIVQKLIEHQADLNAQDAKGDTALHYLAHMLFVSASRLSFMDFLIRAGANPNIKNQKGFTPLHSCEANYHEIQPYLVKRGAEPDSFNLGLMLTPSSDDEVYNELWLMYLRFYLRPILNEVRAFLLIDIVEGLSQWLPTVLSPIVRDYVTMAEPYIAGDIKEVLKQPKTDGKNMMVVLKENLALARNRRSMLFNQYVHMQGIEESDDIKQLRKTLDQSVLLCEQPIMDFLRARVKIKESKILPDDKKTDYGTFFSKDSQMGSSHSSLAISTPKDTKAFEQLQKLLAAAKVLKKDVDTIQKIASAKSVAELREQIDLNLMVRELGELLKKLSDLDPSQRGESGDTIKAIQEGIGCIERLNDLDGKAVGAYHS